MTNGYLCYRCSYLNYVQRKFVSIKFTFACICQKIRGAKNDLSINFELVISGGYGLPARVSALSGHLFLNLPLVDTRVSHAYFRLHAIPILLS